MLLAALLASVAVASEPARPKLVVLEIAVNDSSPSAEEQQRLSRLSSGVAEQVLTEVQATGRYQVLGRSDIATLLGLERQKTLLGCDEQASACLAELSGALGASYVIAGALTRAGASMRLDLKLLQTARGVVVARHGASFSREEDVFGVVSELVRKLVPSDAPPPPAVESRPATLPKVVLGVGLGAAIVGAVLLGVQAASAGTLQANIGTFDAEVAAQQRAGIYTMRAAGVAMVITASIIALVGVIWWLAW